MLTPKRPIIFDFDTFKKELEKLPLRHQIAFNAACCERIIPNYNAFSRVTNSGDPSVPRKALDAVWHFLEGEPMDVVKIHQLIEEIYSLPLDIESGPFGSYYLYEADIVLDAICQTLRACVNPDLESFLRPVKYARVPAEYARDIVYFFVENFDESGEEIADDIDSVYPNLEILDRDKMYILDKHPLSIREIAKQNEDLQRLQETQTLDREFLEWLRTSFDNDGKSNINLG